MSTIICARRVSRHLERECLGRFGRRRIRIQIYKGVFSSHQEEVWRRGGVVNKSGRIEKIRARREDNRRIHSRIQESSEREWI